MKKMRERGIKNNLSITRLSYVKNIQRERENTVG